MNPFDDPMFQASYGTQFDTGREAMMARYGNLSVDPSMMTPSYMGNFRPNYGGSTGYSAQHMPSFNYGSAASVAFGSSGQVPMYLDASEYYSQASQSFFTKTGDAVAWAGQNVALPIAAVVAANKIAQVPFGAAHPLYSAMAKGGTYASHTLSGIFGGAVNTSARSAAVAAAGKRMGMGAVMGQKFGSAAFRGAGYLAGAIPGMMSGGLFGGRGAAGRMAGMLRHGHIAGTAVAGAMGGAGAAVGALAGALLAPLGLAYAGAAIGNEMLFDPYVSARQGADAFRANSSGVFTGTTFSGMGSSAVNSSIVGHRLAADSYRSGMDGSFGAQVLDFGMQAGMYNNLDVGNTDQVARRTKEISQQIKLVMSVAKEPNFVEAVKLLADIRSSGASGSNVGTVLNQFQGSAFASGTSARQLMETVGKQGQFLFQQAGMSPFVGQMQAASFYGGMATARRFGLVGESASAMMGGVDGMTQSLAHGSVALGRSPYNTGMALWGDRGSVLGNLGNFGNKMVSDPYGAYAQFSIHGGAAVADQLKNNPLGYLNQYIQALEMMGHGTGAMSGGKVNADALAAMMLSQGMDPRDVQAQMALIATMQDPRSRVHLEQSMQAGIATTQRNFIEQQGLTYTGEKGVVGGVAQATYRLGRMPSEFKASATSGMDWLFTETTLGRMVSPSIISDRLSDFTQRSKFGEGAEARYQRGDGSWVSSGGFETFIRPDLRPLRGPGASVSHEKGLSRVRYSPQVYDALTLLDSVMSQNNRNGEAVRVAFESGDRASLKKAIQPYLKDMSLSTQAQVLDELVRVDPKTGDRMLHRKETPISSAAGREALDAVYSDRRRGNGKEVSSPEAARALIKSATRSELDVSKIMMEAVGNKDLARALADITGIEGAEDIFSENYTGGAKLVEQVRSNLLITVPEFMEKVGKLSSDQRINLVAESNKQAAILAMSDQATFKGGVAEDVVRGFSQLFSAAETTRRQQEGLDTADKISSTTYLADYKKRKEETGSDSAAATLMFGEYVERFGEYVRKTNASQAPAPRLSNSYSPAFGEKH